MVGTEITGLPGLSRLDHIGFTVPDLAQARAFLVNVLGWEFLYELGPYVDPSGTWMSDHLNVEPRAETRINFFRVGGRATFEVFEYRSSDQRRECPRNSDVGGHHIALYVEDLDVAVGYLRTRPEVRVLGEPTTSKGAHVGQRWIYFLSPWGMQFELVSYPHGRAFYLAEDAARSKKAEGDGELTPS
jgi:catechol 2,3-dioxygenase-like lactoylglutathione lyase family enzyme